MTEALPLLGLFSCGVLADGRKALHHALLTGPCFEGLLAETAW